MSVTYDRLWRLIYPITKNQCVQDRDRWTRILIGAFVTSAEPNARFRERIKRQKAAALKRASFSQRLNRERYDLALMAWINLAEKHQALSAEAKNSRRSMILELVLQELRTWFVEVHGCEPPPPSKRGLGPKWTRTLVAADGMLKVLFRESNSLPKNTHLVRYARAHIKSLRQQSAEKTGMR